MKKPRPAQLAEANRDTVKHRDPMHPFTTLPFVDDHGLYQSWWALPADMPAFDAAFDTGEEWGRAFVRRARATPLPAGVALNGIVWAMAATDALRPRPITVDTRHMYAYGFFNALAAALGEKAHG